MRYEPHGDVADFATLASRIFDNPREIAWRGLCLMTGMITDDDAIWALTDRVIGCGIEVHKTLGPGLLESVYRECLIAELGANHLSFESERYVPIEHKGHRIRGCLKLDLLVEDSIVVELKAVESLHPINKAQVITYLKLTGRPAALIMNFNTTSLKFGLKRVDHPDRYRRRKLLVAAEEKK